MRSSAASPKRRSPTSTPRALARKVGAEVTPAGPFWEVEPEHQNYLERSPHGYTCHFVRADWVLPQRTKTAAG
jgi:peptide methionine sulfoxide reductase MsrA